MIFSFPDFEPSSELLLQYLEDLMTFTVEIFPNDSRGDRMFGEVIRYFRLDEKEFQKSLQHKYIDFLEKQLLAESAERKVKFSIARALFSFLQPGETPHFLYQDIQLTPPFHDRKILAFLKKRELWLLGTNQRLLLLALTADAEQWEETASVLWSSASAEKSLQLQGIKNKLIDDCQLQGGQWHHALFSDASPRAILISGTIIGRYDKYFAPLLRFGQ